MAKAADLAWPARSPDGDTEPICEWAERNIIITTGGRVGRLALDPYQREILDATTRGGRITLMMSSQLCKTLTASIRIAWAIDQRAEQIYLMQATRAGLQKMLREKIRPILDASPALAGDRLVMRTRSKLYSFREP